ncbi:MAG: hypothetical protein OHK0032_00040 [Thermodesulfovibrionales bacterium]
MCEWAIPVKDLDDKGKGKTGNMKNPYSLIPHPPQGTEDQEHYPEEMDEDDCIRKDFEDHISWSFAEKFEK